MEYLTHEQLKKMFFLSWEKVEKNKEQINKINVFPVPDQDTGNNMAKTLFGIKGAIENKNFQNFEELSSAALDGALTYAQGNAGVIYTGFLAGFLPLLNKNPADPHTKNIDVGADAKKLALAFKSGAERARKSIQHPKEGTILDVIDATSRVFQEESEKEQDIIKILKKAIEKAHEALLATREKMEIFRKANVVDAGGFGFLMILESYLESLEGEKKEEKEEEIKPSERIKRFVQTLSNRYEVVFLVEDLKFDEETLRNKLKNLGDSLDVVKIGGRLKLHIHTDFPDEVKQIAWKSGRILNLRVEDMAREVGGEPSLRQVSIGIVTEDITSLPSKVLEKYRIETASAILNWPDLEKIPGENVYQKVREIERLGIKTFPKTSQATPKSYLDAYEKQLQTFDKVLCITVSSKLSGCYNSAVQARDMIKTPGKIFIIDSLNGMAGEALLVLKALEMIEEQREIAEIINELKNLIPDIHTCLMFEDPKWIESIGRITKKQGNWIRKMKKIRLQPVMKLKDGILGKGGIVFAKDMAEALFKKVDQDSKKVRKEGKKIRTIINQADNLDGAEELKTLLKKGLGAEVCFISEAPMLIGAATGPGTLIVAWVAL